MKEASREKDTTIGHWEISGIISERAMPTYPGGFPREVLDAFEKATGRGILCNRPYSGTEVIRDYGEEHMDPVSRLCIYFCGQRLSDCCSRGHHTCGDAL